LIDTILRLQGQIQVLGFWKFKKLEGNKMNSMVIITPVVLISLIIWVIVTTIKMERRDRL
jgi:hypothetical protein